MTDFGFLNLHDSDAPFGKEHLTTEPFVATVPSTPLHPAMNPLREMAPALEGLALAAWSVAPSTTRAMSPAATVRIARRPICLPGLPTVVSAFTSFSFRRLP